MALRILFLLVIPIFVWAQSDLEEQILQLPDLEEDSEGQEQLTQLYHDHWQSIDLNKVSLQQLRQLPWITLAQAQSFITYRNVNGPFIDIYELQTIPQWDLNTIRSMIPFFIKPKVDPYYDPRSLRIKATTLRHNYFMLRYKRDVGSNPAIDPQKFMGSPWSLMGRLRVKKTGDFAFGGTFEKDAGEIIRWRKKQFGFDFWSFYLMLENKGPIRRLIIGDFQGQWDHGLIFSGGFNLVTEPLSKRLHKGFFPHTSLSEFSFSRGVALDLMIKALEVSIFYSKRRLDANKSPSGEPHQFSSIVTNGLHRNELELGKKGILPSVTSGLRLGYDFNKNLSLSISGIFNRLQGQINPRPNKYNLYHFRGSENFNWSIALEGIWENMLWYAQWALSKNSGKGLVLGVLASLGAKTSLSLSLRDFKANFHSIFPAKMGIQSQNRNEQSIRWGWQFVPSPYWSISATYDLFRLPWLTSRADAPSFGSRGLISARFNPSRNSHIALQGRSHYQLFNSPLSSSPTARLSDYRKYQMVLKAKWSEIDRLYIKCRMQWSGVHQDQIWTLGSLLAVEAGYTAEAAQAIVGLSYFDTDNFANRHYMYEPDVLYSFSVPFYHGLGANWYLLIKMKFNNWLRFWWRLSQVRYFYRPPTTSILESTKKDKKTRFTFQIQLML